MGQGPEAHRVRTDPSVHRDRGRGDPARQFDPSPPPELGPLERANDRAGLRRTRVVDQERVGARPGRAHGVGGRANLDLDALPRTSGRARPSDRLPER